MQRALIAAVACFADAAPLRYNNHESTAHDHANTIQPTISMNASSDASHVHVTSMISGCPDGFHEIGGSPYRWSCGSDCAGGSYTDDQCHCWCQNDLCPDAKIKNSQACPVSPPSPPPFPCSVTLYQHGSFQGWQRTFNSPGLIATDGNFPNDDASSLKVTGEGCEVILYEHGDGTGWSRTLGPGDCTPCRFECATLPPAACR